jgi:outer membrane protein assembly factor BamE (lipoprotein component of BamABCDE complex)
MNRLAVIVFGVSVVTVTSGCALGLRPYRLLAGKHFPSERTAELRRGQTRAEVTAVLGDPLESRETPDGVTTWRYHEEFQPRVCTPIFLGLSLGGPPRWTREVIITFRDDGVERIDVHSKGGASSTPSSKAYEAR